MNAKYHLAQVTSEEMVSHAGKALQRTYIISRPALRPCANVLPLTRKVESIEDHLSKASLQIQG
jgi:hypothetical protein